MELGYANVSSPNKNAFDQLMLFLGKKGGGRKNKHWVLHLQQKEQTRLGSVGEQPPKCYSRLSRNIPPAPSLHSQVFANPLKFKFENLLNRVWKQISVLSLLTGVGALKASRLRQQSLSDNMETVLKALLCPWQGMMSWPDLVTPILNISTVNIHLNHAGDTILSEHCSHHNISSQPVSSCVVWHYLARYWMQM